jgi:hypothetical protein
MQIEQLAALKSWFDAYTRAFLTGDPEQDSPLVLKIDHTQRVCRNIRLLGRSIQLSEADLCMAETVGLLHDVGRFEQYRRFKTFNDRKSVNHAVLGVRVIEEKGVLDDLAKDKRELIVGAVRFHNASKLPKGQSGQALLFMKLIRDADKLDIWKVFGDYYRNGSQPEAAIVQHLPDRPECSASIIDAIIRKRMARFSDLVTLNDFRLLQLSWVFDLNFPETFNLAEKRGDLAAIAGSLPDTPRVTRAVSVVWSQLQTNTDQSSKQERDVN